MCFGNRDDERGRSSDRGNRKKKKALRFDRSPTNGPRPRNNHYYRTESSLERQLGQLPKPNPKYNGHKKMPHKFGNRQNPDGTGDRILPVYKTRGRQLYETPEDKNFPVRLQNAKGNVPVPSVGQPKFTKPDPGHSRIVMDKNNKLVGGTFHPKGQRRAVEAAKRTYIYE